MYDPVALPLTAGASWNARALEPICRIKRPLISEITTAAANPRVVPTTSGVTGALATETLQPTLSSERRCCACFFGIDGAHALDRVYALCSRRSATSINECLEGRAYNLGTRG